MDYSTLYDYDLILLGKKNIFTSTFFCYSDYVNETMALEIMKYAFEYYLKWTPEEIYANINKKVITKMKLDSIIRYIRFPTELQPDKDFFYIAHLLYPKKIKYSAYDLILNVYKRVLTGDLLKFPKAFMSETKGAMCAKICFRFMMEQYLQFGDIEEMYSFFAGSSGIKALKEYRLYNICNEMFFSPLEFLHETLPELQKNNFYYNYYRFKNYNDKQKRRHKKEGLYIF